MELQDLIGNGVTVLWVIFGGSIFLFLFVDSNYKLCQALAFIAYFIQT